MEFFKDESASSVYRLQSGKTQIHVSRYERLRPNSSPFFLNCCEQAWVLKNSVIRADLGWAGVGAAEFFFSFLGGEDQRWGWRAEEAHQSLDVLRSRRQKELLPNELHAS